MKPSEIRARVLRDHEHVRNDLERLEARASELADGPAAVERLRLDAAALITHLDVHMRWEEWYLLPVLREADAWGAERAAQLASDHRAQRQVLDFLNVRLHDETRPPALLARDVTHLVGLLRDDMREEEAELLDERVLRDDVIAVDALSS
jgi:iron-sulfur cluster repair protein YtfE (RIC family)